MKEKQTQIKNLKVFSKVEEIKKGKVHRTYAVLQIAIIGINLAVLFLPKIILYTPDNRELLTDNVFDGSQIIISEEEQQNIYQELEQELGIKIGNNNINYLLLNAIYENPYLTHKEKEVFYKFIEFFNDNPYLNLEEVYERLLNVNARFALRQSLDSNENVLAVYLPKYMDIVYHELNPKETTMSHEDLHCIVSNVNLPRWFNEGMTQLIINEYFKEEPFNLNTSYPYEVILVKLLCELVGPNKVLEAYTKDNSEIIYKALAEIIGTEEDAKTLFDYLGEAYNPKDDKTIMYDELSANLLKLYDYGENSKTADKVAWSYYYLVLMSLINEEANDFVKDTVLCKAYISSSLKEKGYSSSQLMSKEEYSGSSYKK